jgi:hypothetical protein
MTANGGFPPIKYIKKEYKNDKTIKKERFFSPNVKELNIKDILASSVIKQMVDQNKNKIDVIDSL